MEQFIIVHWKCHSIIRTNNPKTYATELEIVGHITREYPRKSAGEAARFSTKCIPAMLPKTGGNTRSDVLGVDGTTSIMEKAE